MRPPTICPSTLEAIFAIELRRPINARRAHHVLRALALALRDTIDTTHTGDTP